MAAIEDDHARDPHLVRVQDVRRLLRQQTAILETVQQLSGYQRQLTATDHLEWLGQEQENVALQLRQLLDKEDAVLDPIVKEKLSSLWRKQAELAQVAKEMAPDRQVVEETLARQSEAVRRSREIAEELRQATIRLDVDRLEEVVQRVLVNSQLSEEELSEALDLTKPL